jgi:hypothetical protein
MLAEDHGDSFLLAALLAAFSQPILHGSCVADLLAGNTGDHHDLSALHETAVVSSGMGPGGIARLWITTERTTTQKRFQSMVVSRTSARCDLGFDSAGSPKA